MLFVKTKLLLIFFLFISPLFSQTRDCPENGMYPMPVLSEKTKDIFNQQLKEARTTVDLFPTDYNAVIWYGRRLAYLGHYYDAIKVYENAIAMDPENAIAYRHRGHRWLTLRCFDKAIADFEKAGSLIQGKMDIVEPDGLPNAQNIPTSTLQSNIWYHLGLAYFIKRDYPKALKAYQKCLDVSRNADMYVAALNWYFITLLKLGKKEEAENLLTSLDPEITLIESQDYHQILMLYFNKEKVEQVETYLNERKDLSLLSFGFGLGNYLQELGRCEDARKVFIKILDANQWSSFGFIAAEKELQQLKCGNKTKN